MGPRSASHSNHRADAHSAADKIGTQERKCSRNSVRAIFPNLFQTAAASINGKFFDIPPPPAASVCLPKPGQKPHPPLWMACLAASTIRSAPPAPKDSGRGLPSSFSADRRRHCLGARTITMNWRLQSGLENSPDYGKSIPNHGACCPSFHVAEDRTRMPPRLPLVPDGATLSSVSRWRLIRPDRTEGAPAPPGQTVINVG